MIIFDPFKNKNTNELSNQPEFILGDEMENIQKIFTVYADPPWLEKGAGKIKRGADRHYPLMPTSDIIKIMRDELEDILNDKAHIYLWVTNNFMQDGFRVLKALDFRYITTITWLKGRLTETEHGSVFTPDNPGLGQYFRGVTEHCLFGVTKECLPYKTDPVTGKRCQGLTYLIAPRGAHSQKPEEMYDIIEHVSYPPYLEMFARERRDGWHGWGNEYS